jgi:hypothetical protein
MLIPLMQYPARVFRRWKNRRREKIFCIGKNKTGTTSIAKLFESHGYRVAKQSRGEHLLKDWHAGKFDKLVDFVCDGGDVFQDIPFSLSGTYRHLDKAFPNSKFILTVRDSPEVWYNSLVRSQARLYGNGRTPTRSDLMNAQYRYPGFAWDVNRLVYQTPEDDLYQKEHLIRHYAAHNAEIISYFSSKPGKLLVVNLKDPDAGEKIQQFVGCRTKMLVPWENKGDEIPVEHPKDPDTLQ